MQDGLGEASAIGNVYTTVHRQQALQGVCNCVYICFWAYIMSRSWPKRACLYTSVMYEHSSCVQSSALDIAFDYHPRNKIDFADKVRRAGWCASSHMFSDMLCFF